MRGKNSARWHCRACHKTAFGSESRAEEAMDRGGFVARIYPCPYGNGFHTTKQLEERTSK